MAERSSLPADDAPRQGAELVTADGRSLPLASARLRADAGAGLARYVLEQEFENPYDETLHVTYKMPLPADGSVSGYAFVIGDRTVTGRVDRKEAARKQFEEAIALGKTAALLEQERADIFTQTIGNIPARATILARITVDQRLAWLPEGEWELRFPTVIGPRYVGSTETAEDARAVHTDSAKSTRARIHVELRVADALTPSRSVSSPSHGLSAKGDGALELVDPEGARLDRDIVVRWAVAKPEVGISLETARPAEGPHASHAFGLLTIVPPSPEARAVTVARDLIVLLDTSGSMHGAPLEQAKRVVAQIVESLEEQDRLELIEFSMQPGRYKQGPVAGTREEKHDAIRWVMARKAGGGTEMHQAVMEALRALRSGAQRQVVLLTDGYIGGEEQIVKLCHERLPRSCRLHVVGVGAAPNRSLAAALARAGRGVEALVGLDEDAERATKRLLDRTRLPVLTDLVIEGDALVAHAPEHVPDVFAGAPVLAAAKLRPEGGEIVVRGTLANGTWQQRLRVPALREAEGNQAIVALYAREQVADLEVRWTVGVETAVIDRDIESIGVVYQIATRRTSWVAIDEKRSVDPERPGRDVAIPQELPYGTSATSFGLVADDDEDDNAASIVRTRTGVRRAMQAPPAPGVSFIPALFDQPLAQEAPAAGRTAGRRGAKQSSLQPMTPPLAGGRAVGNIEEAAPHTLSKVPSRRRWPLVLLLLVLVIAIVIAWLMAR